MSGPAPKMTFEVVAPMLTFSFRGVGVRRAS
jgi:hypothetical protein